MMFGLKIERRPTTVIPNLLLISRPGCTVAPWWVMRDWPAGTYRAQLTS